MADAYYRHWRPRGAVRLVILAESHAYTTPQQMAHRFDVRRAAAAAAPACGGGGGGDDGGGAAAVPADSPHGAVEAVPPRSVVKDEELGDEAEVEGADAAVEADGGGGDDVRDGGGGDTYDGPSEYIGVVTCVGYGENELLDDPLPGNTGTVAFWKLLAAVSA